MPPINPLARIIDANANRAREALRVMEDAARFGLDDARLSATLKSLRHDLRNAIDALAGAGLDRGTLLSARDTDHDVGTALSTRAEHTRADLRDVALAASSRLTEALRSIEEAAKALPADGAAIELLRYRAYTAERDLGLAFGAGGAPQWRLCVLITASLCTHHSWEEIARRAVEAGADCLQLREKDLEGAELLSRARRLVSIAGAADVIINDRPDIALLAGARGVHLGQTDLPVAEARRLAGFRLLIGASTANTDHALAATQAGADYCGVGPMFATTTKHKPVLSGPAYLREYLANPILSQRPHLAIGGVNPGNIDELAAAGCRGVAVSSAVCSAKDPAAACRALIQGLKSAQRHGAAPVR